MEIKLGGVVAGSSVADGGSGWGSRSGALKRPSGQAWGNVGAPEAPPRKTSELGAAVPTSPGSVGGASNASSLLPQPPGAPRLGPDPDVMKNIMRRFGGPGGTASDLGISSGSNLAKQLRDREPRPSPLLLFSLRYRAHTTQCQSSGPSSSLLLYPRLFLVGDTGMVNNETDYITSY